MDVKQLRPGDEALLLAAPEGLFDRPPDPLLTQDFLEDANHHMVVALEQGMVVGFVSAVTYVHPDKPKEMWINEIAVLPAVQRQGVGRRLVRAILDAGAAQGCRLAWVLTEMENGPAMRLYRGSGGEQSDAVMFSFPLDRS
jgi:ribosomal protein S18 acetylase RimI-like enzyme